MGLVESTTYRVETVYDVTDRASKALGDIEHHAEGAHHASQGLLGVLGGFGAVIAGSAGIGAAKHAFIDFNKEVQDAKISLATMLQGNYSSTWGQATEGANRLYTEFQRFSQMTPVTTSEMLEFGRGVAVATAQAGGSMKDIITITEQGVVAAKAMGHASSYASLELTEMLTGNVSKRMRFVQQLLGMAHMSEEEFKKLDAKGRLGLVEKVLNSDAMKNATGAFQTSFSGVLSTLEDKVQITLGRAGVPLFKAVTAEISHWSEWLEKNSVKVDHIVDAVGHGLVTGFTMAKNAVMWIVDHADILLSIGKVWMGTKIAGALGGGIGGTISSLAAMGKTGGSAVTAGNIGGNIGSIAAVGTAAYLATTELMKLTGASDAMHMAIDPVGAKYDKLRESMQKWDDALAQSRANLTGGDKTGTRATKTYANMVGGAQFYKNQINAINDLNRVQSGAGGGLGGILGALSGMSGVQGMVRGNTGDYISRFVEIAQLGQKAGVIDQRANVAADIAAKRISEVMSTLSPGEKESIDVQKGTQRVMAEIVRLLASGEGGTIGFAQVKELLTGDKLAKDPFAQGAKPNQTNIKIDRVEVAAKDPDRWIADLDAKAKAHVNAPRTARSAQRH